MINLIERAQQFSKRIAIKSDGKDYTYLQLLKRSNEISSNLLNKKKDLKEDRIAFLIPASFQYTSVQWGIWRAGGIAVPLCEKHPLSSIKYVLDDTLASTVIYSEAFEDLLSPLFKNTNVRFVTYKSIPKVNCNLPTISIKRRALILYTSGTTGLPKGVVTTHANIEAQITALTTSWKWSRKDHILNVLPMHHVHGIINVLSCALWSGGCCHLIPKFDPLSIIPPLTGDFDKFFFIPPLTIGEILLIFFRFDLLFSKIKSGLITLSGIIL